MKKGLTLIELLVFVAIVGILSVVITTSIKNHSCKLNPTKKGCPTEKVIKQITKEESSVASKFNRSIEIPPPEDKKPEAYIFTINDPEPFPTPEEQCKDVSDSISKSECLKGAYKGMMIQKCIDSYAN